MRLASIVLVGCLACGSSTAKDVASSSANPTEPQSPEAVRAPPVGPPPPATPAPPSPHPAASHDSEPAAPPSEGKSNCRFQRPGVWVGGEVTWLGGCQKGFAEGNGVLVNLVEGSEPERFYGRLGRGSPSLGVLQTEGGFLAGRWANGNLAEALTDGLAQRNTVLEAFEVAAAAATAVSKSFARNDAETNRFYAKQARLLREQMD